MRQLLAQLRTIRFLPRARVRRNPFLPARNVTPPTVLVGLRPGQGGADTDRDEAATRIAERIYQSSAGTPRAHVTNRERTRPNDKYNGIVDDVFVTAEMLREAGREISVYHADKEPEIEFLFLSRVLRLVELGEVSAAALRSGLRESRRFTLIPGTDDPKGDDRTGREAVVASVVGHVDMFAAAAVALLGAIGFGVARYIDLTAAVIVAFFGLVVLLVHAFTYGRQVAGQWRYRWLARQPYLRKDQGPRGFNAFAEGIGPAGQAGDQEEDKERRQELKKLLVHAFLEDLRRAYARTPKRRAPWARTVYPILVLTDVKPGSATDRLLRLIDAVRRERKLDDPLLVVAVNADAPERLPVTAPPKPITDLGTAAETLRKWVDEIRVADRFGAQRDIVVLLPPDAADAGEQDQHLPAAPVRPLRWHRAVPWIAAGAVLVAAGLGVAYEKSRYCEQPDVWRADDGQCVGVTNGAYAFDDRLKPITDAIKEENDEIERSDEPSVTVVYFGAMNPAGGDTQPNLLAGVQGELAGVAAQQQVHNESALKPKIKLLLANPGARNGYAVRVAEQVARMTRQDADIVGVVGFGQSTQEMRAAIRHLTSTGLPMVGTVTTFERLSQVDEGRLSPYFFRLAPGNSRLARHAARWAYEGRNGPPARRALVFSDGRGEDLYSGDLGAHFAKAFDAWPGTTVRSERYFDTSDFATKLSTACENGETPPQVIYYSGRADEFSAFYNALNNSTCDPADFTLLAGDDVTKYVRDNLRQLGASDIRFSYTPLALPDERDDWRYWRLLGDVGLPRGAGPRTPSHTHAAVAHDALLMMARASSDMYRDQGGSVPRGGALLYHLSRLTTAYGESGRIKFTTGNDGGHEALAKAVLLVTVTDDGRQARVAHCGPVGREDPVEDRCVNK